MQVYIRVHSINNFERVSAECKIKNICIIKDNI